MVVAFAQSTSSRFSHVPVFVPVVMPGQLSWNNRIGRVSSYTELVNSEYVYGRVTVVGERVA